MAHPYAHSHADRQTKAHKVLSRTGYHGFHADAAADRKMITSAVHQHEDHEHGGKHTKLHLRQGGHVEGHAKHHAAKRARGGHIGGGKHTKVNVIIAPQAAGAGGAGGAGAMGASPEAMAAHRAGLQQGMAMGARGAARAAGAGAPGGGAPGGGAPGGMPPGGGAGAMPGGAMGAGMPPPVGGAGAGMGMQGPPPSSLLRARGGSVHMEAGAGSGEGRIEKGDAYGKGGMKAKKHYAWS